jgi:hypothetical protein
VTKSRGDRNVPSSKAAAADPIDGSAEGSLQVDFDITVVDGAHAQRLAALQAEAVLDVLTWLHEHHRVGPTIE